MGNTTTFIQVKIGPFESSVSLEETLTKKHFHNQCAEKEFIGFIGDIQHSCKYEDIL